MSKYKYKKPEKKVVYPTIEMEEKGRLNIPNNIMAQINYLHGKVGKEEWSGMLLYDVVSGSPADVENFVLVAKHIFLMDIGTKAYTEYSPDGDIVDIYDNIEEAMEWKTGHIHTHHDMGAYFSSTDTGELNDNVDKHNYYLSLIVAFDSRYHAKVAFLSDVETKSSMNYIDDGGVLQDFNVDKSEKHMVTIDMDIYFDNDVFFYDRYEEVIEKEKKATALAAKNKSKYPLYNGGYGSKSQYAGNNDSFRPDPVGFRMKGYGEPAPFEGDPKKMDKTEIEKLARNVISITPELDETRSVYQLLMTVANSTETDTDFYYKFLAQNIKLIISNFFDQDLEYDEMQSVIDNISTSISRFPHVATMDDVVIGITEIFIEFLTIYEKEMAEEAMQDDEEARLLELEAHGIT
ncbi:MAG: hypothetical protein ACTSQF_10115 [Candidatus Heimdallarchaeaceae archaeon]